ncbi:exosome complex component RRP4-like [Oppia nitens]|uniref:exosome complex component RRP4-like n=1 Tax=Oppia nitens TaxID=1686743 RepID=UPI0023DA27F7|nr:exosome complex component RRP4-like [Oppia nitens]
MSNVVIRVISENRKYLEDSDQHPHYESTEKVKYVLPGDNITDDHTFMRGHGTYLSTDKQLVASIAGIVEPINRLISVRPLRTRYNGEIGDVIVGRIIEVQHKRWKVETNSRLDSVLQLSGVNLPGGELRRKTEEDEMAMRNYLKEGDIISAEVQNIFEDGALGLHTRSLKYGKLGQGVMVRVSPSLIERRKNHFHKLPIGVSVILGNNGFVWISKIIDESGGHIIDYTDVSLEDREKIARLRNCIIGLAKHKVMLNDTTVIYAYDISSQLGYHPKDLLMPEVMVLVADQTKQKVYQLEGMDIT